MKSFTLSILILTLSLISRGQHPAIEPLSKKLASLTLKDSVITSFRLDPDGIRIYNEDGSQEFHLPYDRMDDFVAAALNDSDYHQFYRQQVSNFNLPEKIAINFVNLTSASDKPLLGKRIAIDPGHSSGDLQMASLEKKFVTIRNNNRETSLVEGQLNLATALLLADTLRKLGADVFLTRDKPGISSFGVTFKAWKNATLQAGLKNLSTEDQLLAKKKGLGTGSSDRDWFIFFNNLDLENRAVLINKYRPDAVVIIHYNVDADNEPWEKPTDKNFSMVFIPGGFSAPELSTIESRADFLRILVSPVAEHSEELAKAVQSCYVSRLGVPAGDNRISYLKKYAVASGHPGVYRRNLSMTRLIKYPMVYGEPLYQDNKTELTELQRIDGYIKDVPWNRRIKQVSDCYLVGLLQFLGD